MGHIGLTPQSATMLGGFKTQGRTAEAARRLLVDAHRARGRRLLLRSCSRPSPRPSPRGSPRSSRSRRSASAPARTATARCSSTTTCSGSPKGICPASSSATRTSSREIRDALEAYAAEVRTRCRSPARSTRTRCRRRSWPPSRSDVTGSRSRAHGRPGRAPSGRASSAADRPAANHSAGEVAVRLAVGLDAVGERRRASRAGRGTTRRAPAAAT